MNGDGNGGGARVPVVSGEEPLRLLVIEDDQVDGVAVRRVLRHAGLPAETTEVATSIAGLEALRRQAFDCALLDLELPDQDGLALLRSARALDIDTPIIVLTGHGDEQTAVTLMKAGAVDYLSKGTLTPERLRQSLRYAVVLSRAQRAAKRAQGQLRATAERQRFLAEASRVLTSSLDLGTTLQNLVRLTVPTLGDYAVIHLLPEVVGEPLVRAAYLEVVPPAMLARLERHYRPASGAPAQPIAEAMRTGAPWCTDDDETHPEKAAAMAVPLVGRGMTLGAMAFVRTDAGARYGEAELSLAEDLTRRAATAIDNARLFEQLRLQREEAERARALADEANRAKSQFLAMMSHDLRTPLNAIGGYTQLIEMGVHGAVTEPQRESLRRIKRAQEHLLILINDVLNFARIEAGQLQLTIERVPLHETLGGVGALIDPQLRAKELAYEYVAGDPGVHVRADRERMLQVLLNLLTNAVKFTPAGGAIALDWEEGEQAVQIRVRDTGCGIPPEKLEAIFEPFVQVGRTSGAEGEGVGLGLAISRDLARAMGGELSAHSEPGVGSTFTLVLPRD